MNYFIIQNKTNNVRSENNFCVHHLFLPEDDQTCRREIGLCNDEEKLMFVPFSVYFYAIL